MNDFTKDEFNELTQGIVDTEKKQLLAGVERIGGWKNLPPQMREMLAKKGIFEPNT